MSLCSCMQGKEASRRQRVCFQIPLHHPSRKRWGLKFLRRSICKQLLKEMSSLPHWSEIWMERETIAKCSPNFFFLSDFFYHHRSFSLPVHKSVPPWEGREEHSAPSASMRQKFSMEQATALHLASDALYGDPLLVSAFVQCPLQWSRDLSVGNQPITQ